MPSFLWTIKRDVVDYHSLSCDQMLNHYGKTASFTTKVRGRAWGRLAGAGVGQRLASCNSSGCVWEGLAGTGHLRTPPQDDCCLGRGHTARYSVQRPSNRLHSHP